MGMATAGLIIGAVGAAAGAVGAISSGISQQRSLNYQAQIAKNNQIAAYQNAEATEQAGAQKVEAEGLKNRQQQAATTAALAANNVDINSGSALDTRTTEREVGSLDQQTLQHNIDLQAYGYRTQAGNFGAQAALDQSAASSAVPGAALGAAGGLAGSASSLALQWANLQKNGVPT